MSKARIILLAIYGVVVNMRWYVTALEILFENSITGHQRSETNIGKIILKKPVVTVSWRGITESEIEDVFLAEGEVEDESKGVSLRVRIRISLRTRVSKVKGIR
jgi:hypothetical protein